MDIHRLCPCLSASIEDAITQYLWSLHSQLEDLLPPSLSPFRAFCHHRLDYLASRSVSCLRVVLLAESMTSLSSATPRSPPLSMTPRSSSSPLDPFLLSSKRDGNHVASIGRPRPLPNLPLLPNLSMTLRSSFPLMILRSSLLSMTLRSSLLLMTPRSFLPPVRDSQVVTSRIRSSFQAEETEILLLQSVPYGPSRTCSYPCLQSWLCLHITVSAPTSPSTSVVLAA